MSTEKNTTDKKVEKTVKPYNWTAKRKKEAHRALVIKFNRVEPQKRATLNVEYLPDGIAVSKTIGKINKSYTHKMV